MADSNFPAGTRVRVLALDGYGRPGVSALGVVDPNDLDCFLDRRVPEGYEGEVSQTACPQDDWFYIDEIEDGTFIGYVLAHADYVEKV